MSLVGLRQCNGKNEPRIHSTALNLVYPDHTCVLLSGVLLGATPVHTKGLL
jgi:hypothetical protein